jgi:hypothetical protein
MTNVRPSSTFLSVPRYTSAYIKTEKCNFEINSKAADLEPDPINSQIMFFRTDVEEHKKAQQEKRSIMNEFREMYNSTLPVKATETGSKTLLVSPKHRREEVKRLKESINKYVNLKEKCMFVNKRQRQLKIGYRDKIRDMIIRPKTSHINFFSSRKNEPPQKETIR